MRTFRLIYVDIRRIQKQNTNNWRRNIRSREEGKIYSKYLANEEIFEMIFFFFHTYFEKIRILFEFSECLLYQYLVLLFYDLMCWKIFRQIVSASMQGAFGSLLLIAAHMLFSAQHPDSCANQSVRSHVNGAKTKKKSEIRNEPNKFHE